MSFKMISLLLSWAELGALLTILFRLAHTFDLIANTQRELRRAIYHLGERHANELDNRPARSESQGPWCAAPSTRVPVPRAR